MAKWKNFTATFWNVAVVGRIPKKNQVAKYKYSLVAMGIANHAKKVLKQNCNTIHLISGGIWQK